MSNKLYVTSCFGEFECLDMEMEAYGSPGLQCGGMRTLDPLKSYVVQKDNVIKEIIYYS